ncbi:hypothetical protein [Halomonas heilongjiangensis]|uniref:hypothetical protein n=1 Tax=Halomonas heilongjiangensis TaxID=1387883 RepID=UPI000D76BB25|nr:hypothetical protein [Halomonas heilongjiangensis]PXX87834.1 hypothetical protein CR158_15935 [Halomonas heilongjiangensis]
MFMNVRYDGSFVAHDNEGNQYVINIYTDIIDAGTFEDPNATREGLKRLISENGSNVNHLEREKYQIVQTGVVVRSDDPDAP